MTLTVIRYGTTSFGEDVLLENGDSRVRLPISLTFFLVTSGDRRILIDTGFDPKPGAEFIRTPVDALALAGFCPDDITDVVITHAHFDHIGGVRHFPGARIIIQKAESDARELDGMNVVTFDDESGFDLPDGELLVKRIGGHTIGSSVVYVSSGGTKYLLTGDEIYLPLTLETGRLSGSLYDREKNSRFVEEVKRGEYVPVIFHDPAITDSCFGTKRLI